MEATEKQVMEIQTRIDKMEKDLHAIRETGEKTNRSIEQITELLKGASMNPHDKGMLGDLSDLQKENEALKERVRKLEDDVKQNNGLNKWAMWLLMLIIGGLLSKFISTVF